MWRWEFWCQIKVYVALESLERAHSFLMKRVCVCSRHTLFQANSRNFTIYLASSFTSFLPDSVNRKLRYRAEARSSCLVGVLYDTSREKICWWHFLGNVKCRLSVTFVRPTQAIEILGNVSTPFGTLTICDLSVKILRRSSQGNRGGATVLKIFLTPHFLTSGGTKYCLDS